MKEWLQAEARSHSPITQQRIRIAVIELRNGVSSPRDVRPETPLQAASCLLDLCQHIGRIMKGGDEAGVRAAMISDGADPACSTHFVYSWIVAVMPQLHESDADRVIHISDDPVRRRLTLILSPYFRTIDFYRLTLELPPIFWEMEEEARWTTSS
jgi:hypothetical protein